MVLFSLFRNMEHNDKKNSKKKKIKGAIMLNTDGLIENGKKLAVANISEKTGKDVTNVRKVRNGDVNATIDTLEAITEALGRQLFMMEIPQSDDLGEFLKVFGKKSKHWWSVPGGKDVHAVFATLVKMFKSIVKLSPSEKKALFEAWKEYLDNRKELKVEPKHSIEENLNILQALLSMGLVRSDVDKTGFNVLLEILIQNALAFLVPYDLGLKK